MNHEGTKARRKKRIGFWLKLKVSLLLGLFSMFAFNCVSVQTVSQLNPAMRNLVVKKILIVGNFEDVLTQRNFEHEISQALLSHQKGLLLYKSYENIFQGHRDRPEVYKKFIEDVKVEATLVVKVKTYSESSEDVVVRNESSTTKGRYTSSGFGINYDSMTLTRPAEKVKIENTQYLARIDLVSAEKNEIIWTSEGYVSINSLGVFTADGVREYADKTMKDLTRSGIFGAEESDSATSTPAIFDPPTPRGTVSIPKLD